MPSSAPLPAHDTWPPPPALPREFFDQDALSLARALISKVIRRRLQGLWLSARIIETEAYYLTERGSHASLGYTPRRHPLFVEQGGMIYMYYARGGASFNISAHGAGNAVLIKSAHPWLDARSNASTLARMQALNPAADGSTRPPARLCAGQTLLCRALGLKVPEWNGRCFTPEFYVEEVGVQPAHLIQTTRLGIPLGRDEHLPYRYVDPEYAQHATRNPLRRGQIEDVHFRRVDVRLG